MLARALRVSFLFLFLFLGVPVASHAGGFYYEFGGGPSTFTGAQGLYGPTAPGETRFGFGANLLFAINLADSGQTLLQTHVGVKQVFITASQDDTSLIYAPTYFLMRFETPRFYVGGGITPIVFKSMTTKQVAGSLGLAGGAIAGMAEAGLLWKVVPFFYIALEGSAHMARSSVGMGPKPALVGTIQFRVFLSDNEDEKNKRRSKFDGWRYPFGLEIF